MYSKSEKINVFFGSNPTAMMSLMLAAHSSSAFSSSSDLHRVFSSSVSWITTGQPPSAFCSQSVNMKGTRWPRCSASLEGPLPV
jgi:hypothetical protein